MSVRIFLFIPGFNGAILSVVGNVPVNSETPMVTSSISRFASPTQFFGGAHRGRVYVHRGEYAEVLIGVGCPCMRAFIEVASITGSRKKKH
jgi:hypothetical protein